MPVYYKIDPTRQRVTSVAIGTLTDEDLLEHQLRLGRDPDFKPGYQQLFDFTRSVTVEITYAAVATTAANSRWDDQAKRAFVVKSGLGDSLAQLYKSTLGEARCRLGIFHTQRDAEAWLEVGA